MRIDDDEPFDGKGDLCITLDRAILGLEDTNMSINLYGVPASQWRKWTKHQRLLFNDVYGEITKIGPSLYFHPDTLNKGASAAEFQTAAWNAAWIAADCLMADYISEIRVVEDESGAVLSKHFFPEKEAANG